MTPPPAGPPPSVDNRRRHPRARLNILVQHRLENFDAFKEAYAADLSEGGMFMRSTDPKPVGSKIYFQVMLQNGPRLLEGLAEVVRVVAPRPPDVEGGMGLQFINLDEASREVIRDFVNRNLPG